MQKIAIFSDRSCNFSVRMLGYSQKKKLRFFFQLKHKKIGLKSCILLTVWIFFSLQPRLPKTAQDRKFLLEMCLKTHLFSNLWTQSRTTLFALELCSSSLQTQSIPDSRVRDMFDQQCMLWEYGLLSFQAGYTKLERFLPKNQHTHYPKEIIEF